jgi:hypothetical protein
VVGSLRGAAALVAHTSTCISRSRMLGSAHCMLLLLLFSCTRCHAAVVMLVLLLLLPLLLAFLLVHSTRCWAVRTPVATALRWVGGCFWWATQLGDLSAGCHQRRFWNQQALFA